MARMESPSLFASVAGAVAIALGLSGCGGNAATQSGGDASQDGAGVLTSDATMPTETGAVDVANPPWM
jgi:hypothetical protein